MCVCKLYPLRSAAHFRSPIEPRAPNSSLILHSTTVSRLSCTTSLISSNPRSALALIEQRKQHWAAIDRSSRPLLLRKSGSRDEEQISAIAIDGEPQPPFLALDASSSRSRLPETSRTNDRSLIPFLSLFPGVIVNLDDHFPRPTLPET